MSMSAEEAICAALMESDGVWLSEPQTITIICHLHSLGYALHPIAIDEGAVEKAAKAVGVVGAKWYGRELFLDRIRIRDDEIARAAISTYLEAVRAK